MECVKRTTVEFPIYMALLAVVRPSRREHSTCVVGIPFLAMGCKAAALAYHLVVSCLRSSASLHHQTYKTTRNSYFGLADDVDEFSATRVQTDDDMTCRIQNIKRNSY